MLESTKLLFETAAKIEDPRKRLDAICDSGVTFYLVREGIKSEARYYIIRGVPQGPEDDRTYVTRTKEGQIPDGTVYLGRCAREEIIFNPEDVEQVNFNPESFDEIYLGGDEFEIHFRKGSEFKSTAIT